MMPGMPRDWITSFFGKAIRLSAIYLIVYFVIAGTVLETGTPYDPGTGHTERVAYSMKWQGHQRQVELYLTPPMAAVLTVSTWPLYLIGALGVALTLTMMLTD